MSELQSLSCCGISELANIRDDDSPEETIMNISAGEQAFVVFSDVRENHPNYSKGRALAALIKINKLGALVELPPATNPNSDNNVKAWMWRVNRRGLRAYQSKLRKAEPDRFSMHDPYSNPYYAGGW